jgi:hypothetical protein
MLDVGAIFDKVTRTTQQYRLYSNNDVHPAMLRVDPSIGAEISLETYFISPTGLMTILQNEPPGICIGKVKLVTGEEVLGLLGEPVYCEGKLDITEYGGWRQYIRAKAEGKPIYKSISVFSSSSDEFARPQKTDFFQETSSDGSIAEISSKRSRAQAEAESIKAQAEIEARIRAETKARAKAEAEAKAKVELNLRAPFSSVFERFQISQTSQDELFFRYGLDIQTVKYASESDLQAAIQNNDPPLGIFKIRQLLDELKNITQH